MLSNLTHIKKVTMDFKILIEKIKFFYFYLLLKIVTLIKKKINILFI